MATRRRFIAALLVVAVVALSAGVGLRASTMLNFPRVVGYLRVFGIDNQPLPFVTYYIRIDKGVVPTCLLVLRDESTSQFTTTEVNSTVCDYGDYQ